MNPKNPSYRFSFGPWNLSEGGDPFGPPVREPLAFADKLKIAKELGFDAMQFHDDDAVPKLNSLSPAEIVQEARTMKSLLADHGLEAEFPAPRLWEDPRTVDGAYTSNDPAQRAYALERSKKGVDIAHELGTRRFVLWLAREGTYIRRIKVDGRIHEAFAGSYFNRSFWNTIPTCKFTLSCPCPTNPWTRRTVPPSAMGWPLGSGRRIPPAWESWSSRRTPSWPDWIPSDEMAFALTFNKTLERPSQRPKNGCGTTRIRPWERFPSVPRSTRFACLTNLAIPPAAPL